MAQPPTRGSSSTARPVLGIIACNRMVGTEMAQAVMNRYVGAAMTYADTAALIVPSLPDLMTAAEVAPRLDGILLTGSPSNVESARYADTGGVGPYDADRDEIALGLIDRMVEAGKPVFGICRGFQEINVALGGSLRRDVSANADMLQHHAADEVDFDGMFEHRHAVTLEPGGMLAKSFDTDCLTVNSVHYQGIDRLADGLTVEARAPDGLVEAFSARPNGAPLLAVQWHPEWRTSEHAESQTYFHLLGRALRGEL